jgi:hypothetical protein
MLGTPEQNPVTEYFHLIHLTNKTGHNGPVLPVAPQRWFIFSDSQQPYDRWIIASLVIDVLSTRSATPTVSSTFGWLMI